MAKKDEVKKSGEVSTVSLDNFLKLMDRTNEGFLYPIWIPSLNKDVMFREINTAQQKRLIKSIIDSPISNTQFVVTFKDIITENCADKDVDTNQFNILDKLNIALIMRSVSIDDILELEFPTKDEKTTKRGISLKALSEKLKALSWSLEDKEVSYGPYTLVCRVPTIKCEYDLERELRPTTEATDIKDLAQFRETVGNAFISEISKYVKELAIKEGDQVAKLQFDQLNFKTKANLVNKFPEKLTEQIIDFINSIKDQVSRVEIIETEIDGNPVKEKLVLDGSFFTRS